MKAFWYLFFPFLALAQKTDYELSLDNLAHHEVTMYATFSGVLTPSLDVVMSRTSPGRYAVHDFAKNVYRVRAENSKGKSLRVDLVEPGVWRVEAHDGTVKFRYSLFGDWCDGTFASFDLTHAHFNMPAVFVWAKGYEEKPISLKILNVPSTWQIATQLPLSGKYSFSAPNLQFFMDSPMEMAELRFREWKLPQEGKEIPFRMAIHTRAKEEEISAFASILKSIVLEQQGVFGTWPVYDHGNYTFLLDFLTYAEGDGMEHRNSTMITNSDTLSRAYEDQAATAAHEFFHSWNVERIRPRSLEPFDFTRANVCGELWLAEGFTNYFGFLTMRRIGVYSLDEYAKKLSRAVNTMVNSPGRQITGGKGMSSQAVFVDAATSVDRNNMRNTFVSYYTYGEAIGLALDLSLREMDRTLDDFMKLLWVKFGKEERPYTSDDIRKTLAEFSGNEKFASNFFEKYINTGEAPDFEKLLSQAGFQVQKAKKSKPTLGPVNFNFKSGQAIVSQGILSGSPLYAAGIDRDDIINKINDASIREASDWNDELNSHKVGDTVSIVFEQRGVSRTARITLIENSELEVVPFEVLQKPITQEIENFRRSWLGSKALTKSPELKRHCSKCKRAFSFENRFCSFDGTVLSLIP